MPRCCRASQAARKAAQEYAAAVSSFEMAEAIVQARSLSPRCCSLRHCPSLRRIANLACCVLQRELREAELLTAKAAEKRAEAEAAAREWHNIREEAHQAKQVSGAVHSARLPHTAYSCELALGQIEGAAAREALGRPAVEGAGALGRGEAVRRQAAGGGRGGAQADARDPGGAGAACSPALAPLASRIAPLEHLAVLAAGACPFAKT